MEIAERNALVTGGAIRVGRALALAVASKGANVYVHYNSSVVMARQTTEEVEALGVDAAMGSSDLRDLSSAADLIEKATKAIGPISILINNASLFSSDTIENVTHDGWRATHDLTLAAPVFLTQAFAKALPAGLNGAVVNVTDAKTATPYREHFSYIVAKGGLDEFTRAAAVGLAPRIRVNGVALGVILTPFGLDEAFADQLASRLPLQCVAGTAPVAALAVGLIENDFVTGEIVRVDGGGHLV